MGSVENNAATPSCLLHIDASPRRASFSRRASAAFADAWRTVNPDAAVLRRDLALTPVPFIDEAWTEVDDFVVSTGRHDLDEISAVLRDPRHLTSWAITRPLVEELLAASTILIGTPMYNWSIPASLKAWIDHITFHSSRSPVARWSCARPAAARIRPTRKPTREIIKSRTSARGSADSASRTSHSCTASWPA